MKTEASDVTETIHLIDWANPRANDFAIAEEVTLKGNQRATARHRAVREWNRDRGVWS